MRDLVLSVVLLAILPLILFRPHVGLLAWAWIAFMNPHKEVYSYLQSANLNFAVAGLTIVAMAFSKEKWLPRLTPTVVIFLMFMAWTTLSTFTAIDYDLSYPYWELNIKTFILGMLVAAVIDRPSRIHALILIIVISVGYWGVTFRHANYCILGAFKFARHPGLPDVR